MIDDADVFFVSSAIVTARLCVQLYRKARAGNYKRPAALVCEHSRFLSRLCNTGEPKALIDDFVPFEGWLLVGSVASSGE